MAIIDGISVHRIAKLLPRIELEKIITAALTAGQKKRPFTEAGLVDAVGSQTLLEHVPLKDIWNSMIVPKIAQAHSLMEAPEAIKERGSTSADADDKTKKFSPANADPPGAGAAASAFRSGNDGGAEERATPKSGRRKVTVDVDLDFDDIAKVEAGVAK